MSGAPSPTPEAQSITVRAAHLRRMRAARGACWVIVAGLVAVAGVVVLDAAVRLPGWTRGLALAAWVTGVGVLAWRLVVRPWREEPARNPSQQARRELPGNLRAAAAASLALAGCLLAGTLVPGAGDHLRRVAVPWHRTAVAPYRVVVTSGDSVVRRGQGVTLTAYVERTDAAAPAARTARLVVREPGTTDEQQIPMIGDGNAAFHATRAAPADFEYRVESEGATSDWFTVAAIDPATLADGSVTEVQPPRYAPSAANATLPGFAPLDGVQNATAEFRLRFTRPAADAYLEFRAEGVAPEVVRLALSPDRLAGTATFRLKQSGTLRLVTLTEDSGRKLRVEEPTVGVRVRPDGPPRFEQLVGMSPRPMTARPDALLPIAFAASDDIAVGSAVLEWLAPGESQVNAVPIALEGAGTARAGGRVEFTLAGKAKPGEQLRLRLRVFDTRRLDELGLKPQSAAYPEADWATVRVDAGAAPPDVQEIVGRRDAVRDAVAAALNELREAGENVRVVAEDAGNRPELTPDQVARLSNSRDSAQKAMGSLQDAAREASLNPELRPLAAGLRTVIESELRPADDDVRRAGPAPGPERALALASARKHLADAADRLGVLAARNGRTARDQLDARALAGLASDLTALAARTTDPPAELAKGQQELLAAFTMLLRESAPLREATDAANRREFDRLAGNATDLAGMVRDLDEAVREAHADARGRLFAVVVADQKELAERTVALLARIETAARLASVNLPKPEEFRRLADLVAGAKNVEALTEMEAVARSLEAVAATFEKWAADRTDSKVAARHLALWQDDLRTRFRRETAGTAVNFAALPAATRAAFRTEQAAVRAAAASLRVPPGDGAAARDAALEHLTGAANFLNGTGANADVAMKIAADQLNRLAEKLPTIPERLARTRPEFEKVYREQESILVGVEQVFRNSDPAAVPKKLLPFADRQRRQLPAFAALDLPGFDARRLRAAAALATATDDLQAGLPQDVPASQAWVKRELDRLRGILFENAVPPDDRAADLARRLEEAVRSVEASGATPAVAASVQDALRQLGQMPRTPEAAALQNDALESLRTADLAFRNGTPPPERLRRLRTAAEDMARLSDRLNAAESDHDRVRRLAASRRLGSLRARDIAPNSPVSPETPRELARELEELTLTRVGVSGQALKKRLLDEYARLRDKPGADRQAGAHANLATTLDELAAVMADIDELTAAFERTPPAADPVAADAFLPSRPQAAALRELAAGYRASRNRLTDLPGELRKWTRPAATDPLAGVERQQRELAADAAKLATGPNEAATEAATAADRLRNGSVRSAKEAGERAARLLRKLAESPDARAAGVLADRQESLLRELSKSADAPGVVAARQRARVDELARAATDLAKSLEAAARDAGPEGTAGMSLTEAATAATAAGKLLEADEGRPAGKADDAAAQFRLAAARATAAAPTTPPSLDTDAATIGEALRGAELSMRQALRDLGEKPDPAAAARAMLAAAAGVNKVAGVVRARVGTEGK